MLVSERSTVVSTKSVVSVHGPGVEPRRRAAAGGAIQVEGDAGRIGPEQTPADVDRRLAALTPRRPARGSP